MSPPMELYSPAHRVYDQHVLRAAQLEGHVLGRVGALGLVGGQVGAVRHETEGYCPSGHVLPRLERLGSMDEAHRPAHHP